MCCCSCSCGNRYRRSISGTFTQNIPVTMAYRFAPINIGNNSENIDFI